MCARNHISYKYALEWMGRANSDILDLYYRMFDETAEIAMKTIAYPTPGALALNTAINTADSENSRNFTVVEIDANYLRGVAKLESRLIILMDLNKVLALELREGGANAD